MIIINSSYHCYWGLTMDQTILPSPLYPIFHIILTIILRYVLPLVSFYRKSGSKSYWNLSKMTVKRWSSLDLHSDIQTPEPVLLTTTLHCVLGEQWDDAPMKGVGLSWATGLGHGPWEGFEVCKGCSSPRSSAVPLSASGVAFPPFRGWNRRVFRLMF